MEIQASVRTKCQKTKDILANKQIPAVVYGYEIESQSVVINYQEFNKLIKSALMHTVFNLKLADQTYSVLIKSYAQDKVKDTFIHVDFWVINKNREVIVPVPIKFEGDSPAMKTGALLIVAMPKIKVKCLPQNIPSSIIANVSSLKQGGDKIRVSDLPKDEKVRFLVNNFAMVAKTELSRAGKKNLTTEEKKK